MWPSLEGGASRTAGRTAADGAVGSTLSPSGSVLEGSSSADPSQPGNQVPPPRKVRCRGVPESFPNPGWTPAASVLLRFQPDLEHVQAAGAASRYRAALPHGEPAACPGMPREGVVGPPVRGSGCQRLVSVPAVWARAHSSPALQKCRTGQGDLEGRLLLAWVSGGPDERVGSGGPRGRSWTQVRGASSLTSSPSLHQAALEVPLHPSVCLHWHCQLWSGHCGSPRQSGPFRRLALPWIHEDGASCLVMQRSRFLTQPFLMASWGFRIPMGPSLWPSMQE
ncbi:uncharacterized protein LOC144330488 [Macaca mulatta]